MRNYSAQTWNFCNGVSPITRGSSAILHPPRTWDNIMLWNRSWWSCMFSAGVGVGSWFSKLLESDFQKVWSRSWFLNLNNLWDGVGILKNLPAPQPWKWRQTCIKALSEVNIYIPILPALVKLCLVRLVYFIFSYSIKFFFLYFSLCQKLGKNLFSDADHPNRISDS